MRGSSSVKEETRTDGEKREKKDAGDSFLESSIHEVDIDLCQ
jgi:hypothetical protein